MAMKRLLLASIFVTSLSLAGIAALSNTTASRPRDAVSVTFYKDVLPILQNNCQSCHRAGEVAPMALLTYDMTETAEYRTALKEMEEFMLKAGLIKKAVDWEKVRGSRYLREVNPALVK